MVQANFDKYYSFKDNDSKRLFLDKQMKSRSAKRPRRKDINPEGRINYEYVICKGQEEITVCRTAFLNVFCITQQITSHIIKTRKENPASTPKPDARGWGK